MSVWYVDSARWSAVTAWSASAVKTAGNLIRQNTTPTVGNERVFICIVAGITHATTEPTWIVTKGGKTTDNTITWQECTGQAGVNGNLVDCPNWLAVKNLSPGLGRIIQNGAGTHLFIVSTAGLTGNGAEPTWNTTAGATTSDNTVTWTSLGAVSNFTAFLAPHARLSNAFATNWGAAGDTFYVGEDHAATQATALTLSSPGTLVAPTKVICIVHTVAVPVSADLRTSASESTTGANVLTIAMNGYTYGINFNGGSGANTQGIVISSSLAKSTFVNSSFNKVSTGNSSGVGIAFGNATSKYGISELINTTVSFGNVADGISLNGANILWRDTPSAITGATIPTKLFVAGASTGGSMVLDGVDLSGLGSNGIFGTSIAPVIAVLNNCKIGSGVVASTFSDASRVDIVNSDDGATNYEVARYVREGKHTSNIQVIRTGGASDGVTNQSWKLDTTSVCTWEAPFQAITCSAYNSTLATNRTVTIYGVYMGSTLPNNDQVWIDVAYLGSAATPLASRKTSSKADVFASAAALTADSLSAWDSAVTARANTQAYVLGDVIKVASNPDRIFICTTAGTSAGSEPAGYASAVDGGSVTDNAATFRAGVRFSTTVTLSSPQPALVGEIRVDVRMGVASATCYIDPNAVLG